MWIRYQSEWLVLADKEKESHEYTRASETLSSSVKAGKWLRDTGMRGHGRGLLLLQNHCETIYQSKVGRSLSSSGQWSLPISMSHDIFKEDECLPVCWMKSIQVRSVNACSAARAHHILLSKRVPLQLLNNHVCGEER